jgi:HPt (histidine-containing phosphotransfer) domain-containing protein
VDYELNELKREFLAEAQEKVREMQSVLDGGQSSATLDRLAYLAHQLKGSGGSYGYERISSEAAEIEKAVESMSGDKNTGRLEARIQQYVVNLRSEIDRCSRELATTH